MGSFRKHLLIERRNGFVVLANEVGRRYVFVCGKCDRSRLHSFRLRPQFANQAGCFLFGKVVVEFRGCIAKVYFAILPILLSKSLDSARGIQNTNLYFVVGRLAICVQDRLSLAHDERAEVEQMSHSTSKTLRLTLG